MQDNLRKQVKLLKAFQDISYKEIAEYLEISTNGSYNFMRGYYSLSTKKAEKLKEIIQTLKEC
jgi:DNA-directed RNA polymerase specialized sigma24 family protein